MAVMGDDDKTINIDLDVQVRNDHIAEQLRERGKALIEAANSIDSEREESDELKVNGNEIDEVLGETSDKLKLVKDEHGYYWFMAGNVDLRVYKDELSQLANILDDIV